MLKNVQTLTAKYIFNERLLEEFYSVAKRDFDRLNFAELAQVVEIFSTVNFRPRDTQAFMQFLEEVAQQMAREFMAFSRCSYLTNKVSKLEMVLMNFATYGFYPAALLNHKAISQFLNGVDTEKFARFETLRRKELELGSMSKNSFRGKPFGGKLRGLAMADSEPSNEALVCFDKYVKKIVFRE